MIALYYGTVLAFLSATRDASFLLFSSLPVLLIMCVYSQAPAAKVAKFTHDRPSTGVDAQQLPSSSIVGNEVDAD